MITSLDQDEGHIEGDKELNTQITNFYKNLFGYPDMTSISLDIRDHRTIPIEAAGKLIADLSMEEIKRMCLVWHIISPLDQMTFQLNSTNSSWN